MKSLFCLRNSGISADLMVTLDSSVANTFAHGYDTVFDARFAIDEPIAKPQMNAAKRQRKNALTNFTTFTPNESA